MAQNRRCPRDGSASPGSSREAQAARLYAVESNVVAMKIRLITQKNRTATEENGSDWMTPMIAAGAS